MSLHICPICWTEFEFDYEGWLSGADGTETENAPFKAVGFCSFDCHEVIANIRVRRFWRNLRREKEKVWLGVARTKLRETKKWLKHPSPAA